MSVENSGLLVLGASGYIGKKLRSAFAAENVRATYCRSAFSNGIQFDATTMRIADIVDRRREFSHCLILLGDTRLDSCARDVAASTRLNVDGIKRVIDDLCELEIFPIFASSDNVFDGAVGGYSETDAPSPIGVYGRQKFEIERFLSDRGNDHLILRFTKVYGAELDDGTMFTAWLKLLLAGEAITVATDQVLSPVFIDDVIAGIKRLIETSATGIFHIAGPVAASRAELLDDMLSEGDDFLPKDPQVQRCRINDLGLLEQRPLRVSLSAEKLVRHTGINLTGPIEGIRRVFERASQSGVLKLS
jgi:dTDP-4-dehydrorhamnose reductase